MDEDQQAIKDCQLGKTESYRILVEKYKTRAFYAALLITKKLLYIDLFKKSHYI